MVQVSCASIISEAIEAINHEDSVSHLFANRHRQRVALLASLAVPRPGGGPPEVTVAATHDIEYRTGLNIGQA